MTGTEGVIDGGRNEFWKAVRRILSLDDEVFSELLRVIGEVGIPLSRLHLVESVARLLEERKGVQVDGDLQAIIALADVWLDRTIAERPRLIRQMVGDAFGQSGADSNASRLEQLFTLEPVLVAAKASTLSRSHTSLVLQTHILTNTRPVFVESSWSDPPATVVWHTLSIEHIRDQKKPRVVEFAMDHQDLVALASQVERALEIQKSLEKDAKESDHVIWEPFSTDKDEI